MPNLNYEVEVFEESFDEMDVCSQLPIVLKNWKHVESEQIMFILELAEKCRYKNLEVVDSLILAINQFHQSIKEIKTNEVVCDYFPLVIALKKKLIKMQSILTKFLKNQNGGTLPYQKERENIQTNAHNKDGNKHVKVLTSNLNGTSSSDKKPFPTKESKILLRKIQESQTKKEYITRQDKEVEIQKVDGEMIKRNNNTILFNDAEIPDCLFWGKLYCDRADLVDLYQSFIKNFSPGVYHSFRTATFIRQLHTFIKADLRNNAMIAKLHRKLQQYCEALKRDSAGILKWKVLKGSMKVADVKKMLQKDMRADKTLSLVEKDLIEEIVKGSEQ